MTQKNGTIEFIKEEDQAFNIYIKETKKLVSFNKMSGKLFTIDPSVIKTLDALGYKRGKVKIDGVAVLNMTDNEAKRAQRSLERQAEKAGVEAPKVKIEDEEVESSEDSTIIAKEDISTAFIPDADIFESTPKEEIEENISKPDVKVEEPKKNKEKAKKKKIDSFKLKKEIMDK